MRIRPTLTLSVEDTTISDGGDCGTIARIVQKTKIRNPGIFAIPTTKRIKTMQQIDFDANA